LIILCAGRLHKLYFMIALCFRSRQRLLCLSSLVFGAPRSSSIAAAFVPKLAANQSSSIARVTFMQERTLITATGSVLAMASEGDEVAKAKAAAADPSDGGAPTVFDKLLSGEWSSDKVHEDDKCLAFRDINPQGPVHIVVIPKNRDGLTQLSKAREDQKDILGHLLYVAQDVGKKECPSGFRLVINDGEHGAQSVYHLHIHVIGGRQMGWPPG
jgi:histidine triad (HIT) family protein